MSIDVIVERLEWEIVYRRDHVGGHLYRMRVSGGWFVELHRSSSVSSFFYPDPEHTWDGNSTLVRKGVDDE